jgi:hypothetical protein
MECIFKFFENGANKIMFQNLCIKLITINDQLSDFKFIIHLIICTPRPVSCKCAPATLENYYNYITENEILYLYNE